MPTPLPPIGPRLRVGLWTPRMGAELLAIYGDPEVQRYIGNEPLKDLAQATARLEALWERGFPRGHGIWPLRSEADGVVGTLLFKRPTRSEGAPKTPQVELGWHLRRDCWGKGYATEAGWLGLCHGFLNLGMNELIALVDPPNAGSAAVALRLGMRLVERTSRYYDDELELYAMTREDFLGEEIQTRWREAMARSRGQPTVASFPCPVCRASVAPADTVAALERAGALSSLPHLERADPHVQWACLDCLDSGRALIADPHKHRASPSMGNDTKANTWRKRAERPGAEGHRPRKVPRERQ